jgi:hypothetical protein
MNLYLQAAAETPEIYERLNYSQDITFFNEWAQKGDITANLFLSFVYKAGTIRHSSQQIP